MEIDKEIKRRSSFNIDNVIKTFQKLGFTVAQDEEVLGNLVHSVDFEDLLIVLVGFSINKSSKSIL